MSEKVKVLIVEDELIIAESLREVLENLKYEVTDVAVSANKALESITKNKPDLAILDIQLKGKEDGIWLADQISREFDFPYIFLTSHGDDKTVREAVSKHPYGYLLKPFEKLDIFTAIECALSGAERKPNTTTSQFNDFLFVKDEHAYVKIKFEDLLFLKANGNYVELHLDDKKVLVRTSMKDLSPKLPSNMFLQVHRSFTVNLNKIEGFGSSYVSVADLEIPLSGAYKDALMKKFTLH